MTSICLARSTLFTLPGNSLSSSSASSLSAFGAGVLLESIRPRNREVRDLGPGVVSVDGVSFDEVPAVVRTLPCLAVVAQVQLCGRFSVGDDDDRQDRCGSGNPRAACAPPRPAVRR